MRNLSRIIPGEEIHAVAQWDFGDVDADLLQLAQAERDRLAEQDQARVQALCEQARQEGFAQGFEQGQAAARLQAQQDLQRYIEGQGHQAARQFGDLLQSVQVQLAQSQQLLARGVLELSCDIAQQVLRHELSVNPNAVLPVVREGLRLLGEDSRAATVRLHPQDLDVLRDTLASEYSALALTLTPDADIAPGGCVVAAAGTVVDGTVRGRWRQVVARLGLEVAWDD